MKKRITKANFIFTNGVSYNLRKVKIEYSKYENLLTFLPKKIKDKQNYEFYYFSESIVQRQPNEKIELVNEDETSRSIYIYYREKLPCFNDPLKNHIISPIQLNSRKSSKESILTR